jgi:hypothetical protein
MQNRTLQSEVHRGTVHAGADSDHERRNSKTIPGLNDETWIVIYRASQSPFLLSAVTVDAGRGWARDCGERAGRRQWCRPGWQERSCHHHTSLVLLYVHVVNKVLLSPCDTLCCHAPQEGSHTLKGKRSLRQEFFNFSCSGPVAGATNEPMRCRLCQKSGVDQATE